MRGRPVRIRAPGFAIGTTNDQAIPSDPSGSRRYVAIECGSEADWDHVPAHRDQLWAEALEVYRLWVDEGEPNPPPNLLPPSLRDEQERVNAGFTGVDADFDDLAEHLEPQAVRFSGKAAGVKILRLWELAHNIRNAHLAYAPAPPPLDRSAEIKLAQALVIYGWQKGRFKRRPNLVSVRRLCGPTGQSGLLFKHSYAQHKTTNNP